jgi:hypothetical protein
VQYLWATGDHAINRMPADGPAQRPGGGRAGQREKEPA